MKIHYKGKYKGDPSVFPKPQHVPEAHKLKSMPLKKQLICCELIGLPVVAIIFIISFIIKGFWLFPEDKNFLIQGIKFVVDKVFEALYDKNPDIVLPISLAIMLVPYFAAVFLSFFAYIFLKSSCYKQDIYIYRKSAYFFFVSPFHMPKSWYVFSHFFPWFVAATVPFVLSMIFPTLCALFFVALAISAFSGADVLNLFKVVSSIPKGAMVYNDGLDIYWYMP